VLIQGLLLFPLHGAFLIIALASLALRVFVLVDCLSHPDAVYLATGKQTKKFWILALVLGLFLTLIGLIAAIVYLVDVRPALRAARS
jgi:hypothetical protein